MLDVLTSDSFQYALSVVEYSEKTESIKNALTGFCKDYYRNIVATSFDINLFAHSNPLASHDFHQICDALLMMNESITASNDWPNTMDKAVFISNIEGLLRSVHLNNQAKNIISKFRLIKNCVITLFFVGILAAVADIVITKSINAYLLGIAVWLLCCLSLYVTMKLILRDWKKSLNGGEKKRHKCI